MSTKAKKYEPEFITRFERLTKVTQKCCSVSVQSKLPFSLTTARLPEVRDGAELSVDWPPSEPAVVQVFYCLLSVLLTPELDVNVADLQVKKKTLMGFNGTNGFIKICRKKNYKNNEKRMI